MPKLFLGLPKNMIYVLFKSINQATCHPVPSGRESRDRPRKESQIFIELHSTIHFSFVTFTHPCYSKQHLGSHLHVDK